MAHGEFIMMGAYTGYRRAADRAQLHGLDPRRPAARLRRHLRRRRRDGAAGDPPPLHRPLETLLATFGISIALQQLAKNIFGTQARPLTSPDWLDGALVFNDVVSISYIRIAIFVLALVFLALFLFIMNRTRLGLEVRAVTQNPRMAASMGINPDRINMLTFGLGSGIAGIAGVAIGLYAKVTSETGRRLHRAELHDRGRRRRRQHLGHAAGRHADRVPAEGDRVASTRRTRWRRRPT